MSFRRWLHLALAAGIVAMGTSLSDVAMAQEPIPVFAYYYIWYNASSWNRAKIDYPQIGRYSGDEADVMRQHVRWAKAAGITGFVVSWKSTPALDRRLATLVRIADQEHFQLALIYEGLDFFRAPLPVSRVLHDLRFFAGRYGSDAAFSTFGKPVVVWSGTWEFSPTQVASVTRVVGDRLQILASERTADDYERLAPYVAGDAYYWSSVNPNTYPGYPAKLADMGRAVHAHGGLWVASRRVVHDGCAGERCRDVEHRSERLVVDENHLRRVDALLLRLADDDGDGLADEANLVDGEERPLDLLVQQEHSCRRREVDIGGRPHRDDTRHAHGLRNIDRRDLGPGAYGSNKTQMQGTRQVEVADVRALTLEESGVFDAGDAGSKDAHRASIARPGYPGVIEPGAAGSGIESSVSRSPTSSRILSVDAYPLELVDEMFDLAVEMRRERARREFPDLDDDAVEAVVDAWLMSRPAAPEGDSAGVACPWPPR